MKMGLVLGSLAAVRFRVATAETNIMNFFLGQTMDLVRISI